MFSDLEFNREKHLQYYSLLKIRESVAMVTIKELGDIFDFKYFKYTEWKVCMGDIEKPYPNDLKC